MIKSKFHYCHLVWKLCSRQSNNLIKKTTRKSFERIINDDQQSSFQDLISKCKECTNHQRNLETLIAEIYEIINNIARPTINSLFVFCENVHNIQTYQISSKIWS